jgi:anti-sigma regulatory factor (Ser/Thr protein kinase)
MAALNFHFDIDGEDFSSAGEASVEMKKKLRQLGFPSDVIRRCSIAMYEGEINMVIHANGGTADVLVEPDKITMILEDHGPGIPDVELAMKEGYSTSTEQIRNMGFGAGMGLPNMQKNVDKMNVTSEVGVGTTVEMEVNFQ